MYPASFTTMWANAVQLSFMMVEAQSVIAMRTMGMAGLWPQRADERGRMVFEKAPAFALAQLAMTRAAMRGARPDEILAAGLRPLGRRTGANSRRLMRGR